MAARRVQVWNDNTVELKEEFKGSTIVIPPGKYVEMGRSQAIQFKGQYRPIQQDGTKQQTAHSMKILRIEPITGKPLVEKKPWVCQMDGKEFKTEAALKAHMTRNYKDEPTLTK